MNYVDEFVKSSVFVYLAHQGIVLLTVIIGGFFGLALVPECHDCFIFTVCLILGTLFFYPFVILYSFITYLISCIKNKDLIFNKIFILSNSIISIVLYYYTFINIQELLSAGMFILFIFIIYIFVMFIEFIFCLIIPCCILNFLQKKYNIQRLKPQWIQNKYCLRTALFSIGLFLLINLIILAIFFKFLYEVA